MSEPGTVATGSGGTLETERDFLIRSLPLPVPIKENKKGVEDSPSTPPGHRAMRGSTAITS
jgi:hypothetical protein